jgi:glycosyltransferase involved in cell wall biosynthesis
MIEVDIIIPVHNAEQTLRETLDSALSQQKNEAFTDEEITIYVCCYDDASTDTSLEILTEYQERYKQDLCDKFKLTDGAIETQLFVSSSSDGISRCWLCPKPRHRLAPPYNCRRVLSLYAGQ